MMISNRIFTCVFVLIISMPLQMCSMGVVAWLLLDADARDREDNRARNNYRAMEDEQEDFDEREIQYRRNQELRYAVANRDYDEAVRNLACGAQADYGWEGGPQGTVTLLDIAVDRGNDRIVKLLLAHGASPTIDTHFLHPLRHRPLLEALTNKNTPIVRTLLLYGAAVDDVEEISDVLHSEIGGLGDESQQLFKEQLLAIKQIEYYVVLSHASSHAKVSCLPQPLWDIVMEYAKPWGCTDEELAIIDQRKDPQYPSCCARCLCVIS